MNTQNVYLLSTLKGTAWRTLKKLIILIQLDTTLPTIQYNSSKFVLIEMDIFQWQWKYSKIDRKCVLFKFALKIPREHLLL